MTQDWLWLNEAAREGFDIPRFFLSASNIQRAIDTRKTQVIKQCGDIVAKRFTVVPNTTQIRYEAGRIVAVRTKVEHWDGNPDAPVWAWERKTEWDAVGVSKLVATWDEFRRRCPRPEEYKRVVRSTPEWHMAVMRSDGSGEPYQTTKDSCNCGSYKSQEQHEAFLAEYIPGFRPFCKHMAWFAQAMSREEDTRALWRVDSDGQVVITVWPTTRPITSPMTKQELTPEGGFQHYGTYPASRLTELHSIAMQRGWSFEKWEPDPALVGRMQAMSRL